MIIETNMNSSGGYSAYLYRNRLAFFLLNASGVERFYHEKNNPNIR
jgi:hypothetical protein